MKQKLILKQTDEKLSQFHKLSSSMIPSNGWIYSIRRSIKMTLKQIGQRLGISVQSAKEIEQREKDGTITLKALKEIANALDLDLVYVLIPREKTLENMIQKRAKEKAIEIVQRTSQTMKLENQEVSAKRLNESIRIKTEQLIQKMPTFLWD